MPHKKHKLSPDQLALPFGALPLPLTARFPTNEGNEQVHQWIETDLEHSEAYLIISGFASLEYLVQFLARIPPKSGKEIRIVLGNEPLYNGGKLRTVQMPLAKQIESYWLEQGISIVHSSAVIHAIELIESRADNEGLAFRMLNGLHAKIYLGENHVILGSSNFTMKGLKVAHEANARFAAAGEDPEEQRRYAETRQLAEYFWAKATDCNALIVKLLKQLLSWVTWQEALARAAAEVLVGKWLDAYPELGEALAGLSLWPTQVHAIGQALFILDNYGSLLIADPTGSGKTRMGAALRICLINRLWSRGRGSRTASLIACPPNVAENWLQEARNMPFGLPDIISHGKLSGSGEGLPARIANAHVLFIDEAHRFLNRNSNRTKAIEHNISADQTVLFTATPINRKVEDIFRMVELLDLDHFPDEIIRRYEKLPRQRYRHATDEQLGFFRNSIRHFIIRRTKRELNQLIDREPDRYHNRLGNPCRFPHHHCHTYSLKESKKDIALAEKIDACCNQLKGLLFLRQKVMLTKEERTSLSDQEKVIQNRCKAAAGLAKYQVQDALRSSRAALWEYLAGTEAAKKEFGISEKFKEQQGTGNVIQTLEETGGHLPKTNALAAALPLWLRNPQAFQEACTEEVRLYQEIWTYLEEMSPGREQAKIDFLLKQVYKTPRLLAFDQHLISLHLFFKSLNANNFPGKTLMLTGGDPSVRARARHFFGLESKEPLAIGLCSDAMSEGINLQGASGLVLLDMPGVMRLAEQRIGRIDRMDSPHADIHIFWPNDHKAFALQRDRKFFKMAQDVEYMIGGNVEVPEEFREIITAEDAIRLHEAKEEDETTFRDGLQDAFQPLKDLVEGNTPLVPAKVYEQMKNVETTVISHVSMVKAPESWAFFALRATAQHAPRWLFVQPDGGILTDLPVICEALRRYLPQATTLPHPTEQAGRQLARHLEGLQRFQIEALPHKKRRAIRLFQHLIDVYLKRQTDLDRKHLLQAFRRLLDPATGDEADGTDYYHLAEQLLDEVFQPLLNEWKAEKGRYRGPVHLQKLKSHLMGYPIPTATLQRIYDQLKTLPPISRRVAACIVAVQ